MSCDDGSHSDMDRFKVVSLLGEQSPGRCSSSPSGDMAVSDTPEVVGMKRNIYQSKKVWFL